MGSGEFSATMVEVHKAVLGRYGRFASAVFLDTPAGFQLNADAISQKASDYFNTHIQHSLTPISFKSIQSTDPMMLEEIYEKLTSADYIVMGPGSPTYALYQWQQTRIPEILIQHIHKGGSIAAASAAALTMGRLTLPVYEIYKVGQSPYWIDGMNLLNHFDFDWVVLPHWNNAEGGNHDTRFCFMGETRLNELEAQLPGNLNILGVDEHTAFIVDLARDIGTVKGIGRVTLRQQGCERIFSTNAQVPLGRLRRTGEHNPSLRPVKPTPATPVSKTETDQMPAWSDIEKQAWDHLEHHRIDQAIQALLALEDFLWTASIEQREQDTLESAREALRNLLVRLGSRLARLPSSRKSCLAPLVERCLALRVRLKQEKQYPQADAIRDCLSESGVIVEDTPDGVRWYLKG
jgi:peptidase E